MDWMTSGQMPGTQADGEQTPSAPILRSHLTALLAMLDASGETMAATYVQMAIDVLSDDGAGDNT